MDSSSIAAEKSAQEREVNVTHSIWHRRFRVLAAFTTALALAISTVSAAPTQAQTGNGLAGPPPAGSSDRASAAVAVTIGSGWQEFSFLGVGAQARGCFPADPSAPLCSAGVNSSFVGSPPWTFTGAAQLQVTDAFSSGDVFQIFDNNILIGTTSTATSGADCGNNPDTCFTNASMSKGTFNLADGSHSITIVPTQIASGAVGGVGFFRLTTGVGPGGCTITQTATKTGTTLNLTYTISTSTAANWTVFLVVGNAAVPIINNVALPAITTPVTAPIPIPNFPSLGAIGVLTTISGTTGIMCSDFDVVTT